MKFITLILFACACALVHSQTIISFDTSVLITAGTPTTLTVTGDISASLTTNLGTSLIISKITTTIRDGFIPSTISTLSKYPVYGYRFVKTNVLAALKYQVQVSAGQLASNVSAGYRLEVIQYDTTLKAYYALNARYDATSSLLSFTPETLSTTNADPTEFYIVQISQNSTIPILPSRAIRVRGTGSIEQFETPYKQGFKCTSSGSFTIRLSVNVTASVNTTNSPMYKNVVALYAYSVEDMQASVSYNCTITNYYDKTMLIAQGVRDSTIRFAKYSADKSSYVLLDISNTVIDAQNQIIQYTTSDLAGNFGIFAESAGQSRVNLQDSFQINAGLSSIDLYANGTLAADIQFNASATTSLSINARSSVDASLPTTANFQLLNGQVIGFAIVRQNTNASVAAFVGFRVPASVALFVLAGYRIEALQFDSQANQYFALNADFDSITNRLVIRPEFVATQSVTVFYIGMVQVGVALPGVYGRLHNIRKAAAGYAGDVYTFSNKQTLRVIAQADMSVRVSDLGTQNPYPSTTPGSTYTKALSFSQFTAISADGQANASFDATISYNFKSSELVAAGIVVNTLRYARFDTSANAWVFLSGGFSVDVSAQVVSQQTSRFSSWGVFAESNNGTATTTATGTPTPTPTTAPRPNSAATLSIVTSFIITLLAML